MEAAAPFSPRTWSSSKTSDASTASNIRCNIKSDGAVYHLQEEEALRSPPSQLHALQEQVDSLASCMASLREEVQQISVQRRLDAALLEEGLHREQRDLRDELLSSLARPPLPEALHERLASCEQRLAKVGPLQPSQLVALEGEVVLHSWQAEMQRCTEGFAQALAEAADKHAKELLELRDLQTQHGRSLEDGFKTLEGHVHVVDARVMDLEEALGDRGQPLPLSEAAPPLLVLEAAPAPCARPLLVVAELEQLRGRLGGLEEASCRLGKTQLELVRSSAAMVSIHEAVKDRLSALEAIHGESCQELSKQIEGLRARACSLERRFLLKPSASTTSLLGLLGGGPGHGGGPRLQAKDDVREASVAIKKRMDELVEEQATMAKQLGPLQPGAQCAEQLAAALGDRVEFLEGMLGESVELILAQAKSASEAKALRQEDYSVLEERLSRVEGGPPLRA